NLSAEKEQEYFSDGMAEEILNALAQIDGLRVIGRTSSFFFIGRNDDLRTIGEKLGASNLLEGSVRKAGSRVRITAQLVETRGGSHLWSQTFDRGLTEDRKSTRLNSSHRTISYAVFCLKKKKKKKKLKKHNTT